jgi:hypothetical protein
MNENSILLGADLEEGVCLRQIKLRENGGVYYKKI